MRTLKRVLRVFLIAIICLAPVLFSACAKSSEAEIKLDNTQTEFFVDREHSNNLDEEILDSEKTNEKEDDIERTVFIEELETPASIYLENNKIGIEFYPVIYPSNAVGEIDIIITNTEVLKFGKDLTPEEVARVNFTKDNCVYPLSEGNTYIVCKTIGKDGEIITTETLVVVKNFLQIENLTILNKEDNEVLEIKSGKKANGDFEIYTAKYIIEDAKLNEVTLEKSNNLVVVDTKVDENGFLLINFYAKFSGESFLKLIISKNYINSRETVYKKNFNSSDFIQGICIGFYRENLVEDEESIKMYFFEDEELSNSADSSGYYTFLMLEIYDLNEKSIFHKVTINIISDLLVLQGNKLIAKGCGEAILEIKADDGSGVLFSKTIEIITMENTFELYTVDESEDVEYLFEWNKIIVKDFKSSEDRYISFKCGVLNFLEGKLEINLDIKIYGSSAILAETPGYVCIKIKEIGEFCIKIKDINSGISKTISVIVKK